MNKRKIKKQLSIKEAKKQKLIENTRNKLNTEKQEWTKKGFDSTSRVLVRDTYLHKNDKGEDQCSCGHIFPNFACGEPQVFNHVVTG